jgi:hypothetical protein
MTRYRHNHYVPIWYQRRFMHAGQDRYYRLDLKPDEVVRENVRYTRKALHHWSPDLIFAQDDLYTTKWEQVTNTEIEQFFFGQLDAKALVALEYFSSFKHPGANVFCLRHPFRCRFVAEDFRVRIRATKQFAEFAVAGAEIQDCARGTRRASHVDRVAQAISLEKPL